MNEFAKFLDKKMNERNITARELSYELNVAQSYVYNWLKSERIPSTKKNHLDTISKVLHLSLKEVRELRESYILAKEDVLGLEKKNLISSILKMPVNQYLKSLDIDLDSKSIDGEYKLIHKNDFKKLIKILFGDMNFNDGDEVYISCDIFDERYFDIFFAVLKKILNRGVSVVQILPLKQDSVHNIKILKKLLPLYFESKGNYTTRYVTNYETVFPIIYTKEYVAMFFSREILIYNDIKIKKLLKYEFETYIDNTLTFVNEVKNDFFKEKLPDMLYKKGNAYMTLGYRHHNLLNEVLAKKNIKANLYNIFYESEILDSIDKELNNLRQDILSVEDFKSAFNNEILVDESYYSGECPVYTVVSGNELALIFYINKEQIILNVTERLVVNSFENFYSRIIYKYDL